MIVETLNWCLDVVNSAARQLAGFEHLVFRAELYLRYLGTEKPGVREAVCNPQLRSEVP